jgi:hypothetical protein
VPTTDQPSYTTYSFEFSMYQLRAQHLPQRDLANTIYERLRGGADVDEVAHLINDLSRTTRRRSER